MLFVVCGALFTFVSDSGLVIADCCSLVAVSWCGFGVRWSLLAAVCLLLLRGNFFLFMCVVCRTCVRGCVVLRVLRCSLFVVCCLVGVCCVLFAEC